MRGVELDPRAPRARVEAGAWWGDVAGPAAEHGLAALAGSSPDVGVVGYSLGGGVGWLARRHGLACHSILAADVVTADGRLVRADAESEPDLFWAIRRRRRELRRDHRPRDRPLPGRAALRRGAVLPARAGARGAPPLGRLGAGNARRGHLGRAHAPAPAASRASRPPARAVVLGRRGGVPRRRGRRRRAPAPPAGARPRHGHLRHDHSRPPARAAHGPARAGAGDERPPHARGRPARGDRRARRGRGPGVDTPLLSIELRHLDGAARRPARDGGPPGTAARSRP